MGKQRDGSVAGMKAFIQKRLKDGAKEGAEKGAPEPEWRPVPGVPFVEAHRDGRLRRVSPLPASGMVDAQVGGLRVRAAASTLHHNAWPELWPAHLKPAAVRAETVPEPPKRPFRGIERAPGGSFETPCKPDEMAGTRINWEGVLVDLDGRLIDEGGYFVNYAGERVLEPVQGEPDPEAGE